jgi:hypothetical protein
MQSNVFFLKYCHTGWGNDEEEAEEEDKGPTEV